MLFRVTDPQTNNPPDLQQAALTEAWADHLDPQALEGWAVTADGILVLLDQRGRFGVPEAGRFQVEFEK